MSIFPSLGAGKGERAQCCWQIIRGRKDAILNTITSQHTDSEAAFSCLPSQ
jgi:hypothetical protein